MNVFFSPYENPFLNLALEDFFLRGGADHPLLFLYVNRPSVILGRFQNPWLECHLPYLAENDIWMVRRQSGGGCVYHDQGNLNFSFITSDPMVDRKKHAELLKEVFATAQINLQISPRNDLWLEAHDGTWKKISGSAYKQTKFGSFHHGTFLVNSNLDKLEESLKHTVIPKNSKSIASVRSKVISLEERFPHVQIPDVLEIISHGFKTPIQSLDGLLLSRPLMQESFKNLLSWEWLWGETPAFDLETLKGDITIHKGKLKDPLSGQFNPENMKTFLNDDELKRLFPDFSEQHRSSNLLF